MNTYKIISSENGCEIMEYQDIMKRPDLLKFLHDKRTRTNLFLGRTILTYDRPYLTSHPSDQELVTNMSMMLEENPIMFFLPSGPNGIKFLNDTTHDVKMLIAPNRVGKTASAVVDILLDIIPTDASWPIFKEHGVLHRPFNGAVKSGFASSDWKTMMRTMFPEILKWIPKYQLGDYDPRKKNGRTVNWKGEANLPLICGSECFFYCYEQDQGPFESQALGRWLWDEQGQESKFDGGDERLRTIRGGRHVFALTPHKVEGRPDTGARSWIHKMMTGEQTKGHEISTYSIPISDAPDWVYPEDAKHKAYVKWVEEPKRLNNLKAQKEGDARFYGKWQDSAGLVFDEYDENYHIIDPFPIPDTWTRYRALDHGVNNPTACIFAAVSPDGDVYVYQEYFENSFTIFENCRNIVELAGNKLKKIGTDARSGLFCDRYAEVCSTTRFRVSVGDSRSLGTQDALTGLTNIKLYLLGGLRLIPASGRNPAQYHAVVKQYLAINSQKTHPRTGKLGSPSVFIFRNLSNMRRELTNYARAEWGSSKAAASHNRQERAREKDDHLIDALVYLLQIPPRYIGGVWANFKSEASLELVEDDDNVKPVRDPYTGEL